MMISDLNNKEAYVWIWLPEETKPVVAGKLEYNDKLIYSTFAHKKSLITYM